MPYLFITNGTHAWQTAPSPHPNSRALKDGPGLRRTLLSETTRKLAVAVWTILRTRPAGNGPQCLTLLFEPTRKLAVFQPPTRLTNGALATANQQRPEGRTEPCGSWVPAATKEAHKRRPRHSETAGPWSTDRACGQRPPVPSVAFWTYKKTSCLPAAKELTNGALATAKQQGPEGRTDRACGQRPPVPNVAFWTYKKTSCLPAANKAHKRCPRHSETASCLPAANKAHKRRPRHSETAGPWGTDRPSTAKQQGPEGRTGPAGHGPQCLTSLSEPTRKLAVFQPPTRPTNGALATAKQQGPEGRTGPAGHGPQCLTSLSEPTRKLAVFQPPTRPTNGAATAKHQGPEGRTGPAGHGPQCLTSLSEPTRKLAVFQPPTRPTNGALATAKQQGPDGRTGPAGHGPRA